MNFRDELTDGFPVSRTERIAAGKGHAVDVVAGEVGKKLLLCRVIKGNAALRVPCLRILAPRQ